MFGPINYFELFVYLEFEIDFFPFSFRSNAFLW